METEKRLRHVTCYVVIILLLCAISGLGYTAYTKHQETLALRAGQAVMLKNNAQATGALEIASTTIITLNNQLEDLREDLADTEADLAREEDRNEEFEDQIKQLAGTVGTLDKLSKTDEELLQKYSKVYFLNENYIPSRLSKIDDDYIQAGKGDQYFHAEAVDYLADMIDAANDDGVDLKVVSAYRSFETQSVLKGSYTQVYGSGANTFSADQGYSEHQLGTTLDITDPTTAGTYTSFKDTEAYTWLLKNAHRYGFVLSYPEGNTFYVFEPWHWRFVGTDLARDLDRADAHFYDWEQRKIDEYLISIFD